MKSNKLFFLLIFIILLVPFVLAQPPLETTVSAGDNTFEIEYPLINTIKINDNHTFNFHLYNKSTGLPIQNDSFPITCFFHLYNSSGNHIFTDNNVTEFDHEADFEVKVDRNNFTYSGTYSLLFQCNSTSTGGFIAREIMVTNDGNNINGDESSGIAVVIFILVISLMLFVLPFIKDKFAKNVITNLIIKRSCWTLFIYLMMLNSAIVSTIAYNGGLNLTKELFRYMWLFGTAGWIFMGFMVLKTILDILKLYRFQKEYKRTGIKNDDEDDEDKNGS